MIKGYQEHKMLECGPEFIALQANSYASPLQARTCDWCLNMQACTAIMQVARPHDHACDKPVMEEHEQLCVCYYSNPLSRISTCSSSKPGQVRFTPVIDSHQ